MDANLFTNVLLMFSINFMGSDNGFMSFHQKENGTYLNVLIVGVRNSFTLIRSILLWPISIKPTKLLLLMKEEI